jgi:hypothetical protein
MSDRLRPAALGWRAHSGWAVLVAVAGELGEPAAVGRWRVELADAGAGGSPQPYHLAAEAAGLVARTTSVAAVAARTAVAARAAAVAAGAAPGAAGSPDLARAGRIVRRCAEAARLLARQALATAVGELRQRGLGVAGCGIVLASGRPAPTLAEALASHAMIHTAEGELFRAALVAACESCELRTTRVRERELFARAEAELGLPAAELRRRATAMGRELGPPWRQDHKHAAIAAWLALGSA